MSERAWRFKSPDVAGYNAKWQLCNNSCNNLAEPLVIKQTSATSMKNIKFPIYLTSSVLAFYSMTPFMPVPYALVATLFLSLNVLIIWMVVRVLKDGVPSQQRFTDTWYEDYDSRANL
jgi:hypothetical protein